MNTNHSSSVTPLLGAPRTLWGNDGKLVGCPLGVELHFHPFAYFDVFSLTVSYWLPKTAHKGMKLDVLMMSTPSNKRGRSRQMMVRVAGWDPSHKIRRYVLACMHAVVEFC